MVDIFVGGLGGFFVFGGLLNIGVALKDDAGENIGNAAVTISALCFVASGICFGAIASNVLP